MVVQSPARLHFGLIEICPGQPWLFGGCGMTIEEPSMQLSFHASDREWSDRFQWRIECSSPWKERIEAVLENAQHALDGSSAMHLETCSERIPLGSLRIDSPPLAHAGLGSGTQLACSAATLFTAVHCVDRIDPSSTTAKAIWEKCGSTSDAKMVGTLAKATGRGARSYVGLVSHLWGGFIVDHGMPENLVDNRAFDRFSVPDAWRVVLARPIAYSSISGAIESDYFQRCAIPNPERGEMIDLIQREMIPAIQASDLSRFGHALYQYGRYGGELFRAVQGGVYRDSAVTKLIEFIRGQGITATGQTSWGPTVYAIVGNQNEAIELEARLRDHFGPSITTLNSRPSNRPCTVSISSR